MNQARTHRRPIVCVGIATLLIVCAVAIRPYGVNNAIALLLAAVLVKESCNLVWLRRVWNRADCISWRKLTAAALALALVVRIGWIQVQQGRRQIADRMAFTMEMDHRFGTPGPRWQFQVVSSPSWNNWLRMMWLLGAGRADNFRIALGDPNDERERIKNLEYVARAQKLFPEATISVGWRGSATPGISQGRRPDGSAVPTRNSGPTL